MSDNLIRRAAFALNPNRPIMMLAGLARGRRSTAKSWAIGHRRPSIERSKFSATCSKSAERTFTS